MNKNILYFLIASAFVLLFASCEKNPAEASGKSDVSSGSNLFSAVPPDLKVATLYRSPYCGCCEGYAKIMRRHGFTVQEQKMEHLDLMKKEYGVPAGKESCHTTKIGDYVVEGHVPLEALKKLLTERPDIDGIGLAGMATGTPGMPGKKEAPFQVYQFKGDKVEPFGTF